MCSAKGLPQNKVGSSCVSGGWRDQQFDQRTQQRFAPFLDIVNELEEPQVKGEISYETSKDGRKTGSRAVECVERNVVSRISLVLDFLVRLPLDLEFSSSVISVLLTFKIFEACGQIS